ncbi:unnamed protein product [Staurois parvus]|uniref:Secreted protein n=1 Tax=Staurois parvus TaxID=386267 RepID=A0ABN9CMA2_9NEOB|nr:unnamed protein product [Staurois parvus]CAI9560820.1 unnamed protein product [Staurois parvus]
MCHFQVSSHCWWFPFCHRCAVWPPIAASLHRHTGGSTLCFGPVYCPMSEMCGDSKIDTALSSACHTDCQYYFSSPQLQGHLN